MKERAKMAPYSPRNNKANKDEPYSTLNPLTNSLSPSAKSKGARFVSANKANNHIKLTGKKRTQDGNLLKTGLVV